MSSGALRIAAVILATAGGAAGLWPGSAHAAACPSDLTVAGVKVTGQDCVAEGAEFVITNPRFGATEAQKITGLAGLAGKMRLNSSRTEMTPEPAIAKLQLAVGTHTVFIGPIKVGKFELCELEPASPDPPAALVDSPGNEDLSGKDARVQDESGGTTASVFVPRGVGCRETPAFKLDFATFDALGKLAGLDIGKLTAKIPTVAGFDDEKGGRVFMAAPLQLPKVFDAEIEEGGKKKKVPTFVALGVELSVNEGLKPFSGGFRLNRSIPLGIPGLSIASLSGVADLINDRFGGGFQLRLPGGKSLGANLALHAGDIEQLSGDVALPVPIPMFGGAVSVTSIGGSFQGEKTQTGPGGAVTTTPRSVQGRAKFTVGPAAGGGNPFQGDMALTLAGPSVKLAGNLFAVVAGKQVKLGDARVLVAVKPARFEAEANATLFDIIKAHVFLGIVPEHFTGLGEASVVVPEDIKFIGGQRLGGFSLALSDVGVGTVITLDPPFIKPFTVGVGTTFKPLKFKRIDSVQQFITVKPSGLRPAGAGGLAPQVLAAGQRTLRLPRTRGDVIVSVTGRKRVPRRVKLTMSGRRLKVVKVGAGDKAVQLGLASPPAGRLRVSSPDALARIEVGRVKEFPYLDPSPGFGTQPRGPVTAGQPAHVCWTVKNAPPGAVVDLFEDQNGNLGTGRNIATGRAASGCFDVPTTGLEPGRHWVYGVVRAGQQPISQRYWPVPITVVDPTALPAPSGVSVTPTADGASVAWSPVDGAGSYVVRAEPVDEHDGEPIEQDAAATELSADLSLRGAADWNVTVQAVLSGGGRGNASAAQPVTPTDPVVVAGEPNGVAQVGNLWAFQLKVFGGVTLRLVNGPAGMRLVAGSAQLRWTPSRSAGSAAPQEFTVEGCKEGRCVTRTFNVSAYARGFAPAGPARGFQVTPNVLKPRGGSRLVTIRAQGIDATPVVKIDGKRVRGVRRLNAGAVEFRAPKLSKGAHGVSLKVGSDAEERKPGALVVV